ncbi:hypothetical protein [Alkalihalobacillus sp. AL-G]|uniref:hypothetical protein n=1 Tax=Alkalihalobacillus sp. AL-G TaxID=2926399 RepID=UPI00272B28C3|nr:hypothetical protein [Alkalihalobacillus sp. AL-G]WLD94443.1 hypothetical protein MOJ78_06015 [Alkalihalobacillus sp. AL-G]
MTYSNDPIFYIIPLLLLGTIILVYALKKETSYKRFKWLSFVVLSYGAVITSLIPNIKISIIGMITVFVIHLLMFRSSEEFYNKYIKRK